MANEKKPNTTKNVLTTHLVTLQWQNDHTHKRNKSEQKRLM